MEALALGLRDRVLELLERVDARGRERRVGDVESLRPEHHREHPRAGHRERHVPAAGDLATAEQREGEATVLYE